VLVERQARPASEAPLSGLDERLQEHHRPAPTLSDYNELIIREAGQ